MKRKHIFATLVLMAAAYVALICAACYTTFHAADVDFKTYPVHRQDTVH